MSLLAPYMTRSEVASELGISLSTLARWRRLGCAPPLTRVGNRLLYRREAVAEWLRGLERDE